MVARNVHSLFDTVSGHSLEDQLELLADITQCFASSSLDVSETLHNAIQQFMEKVCAEFSEGKIEQAIVLTHNYTDTKWFHHAAEHASAICFTKGRIGFLSPEGKRAAPTQGQAFFYFGDDLQAFSDAFKEVGFVVSVMPA